MTSWPLSLRPNSSCLPLWCENPGLDLFFHSIPSQALNHNPIFFGWFLNCWRPEIRNFSDIIHRQPVNFVLFYYTVDGMYCMNGSTNILGVANFPEVKYNGYVSPKCHYFLRRILREIYVTSKKREGRADIDFSSANSCVACVPNPTQMARAFPSSFSVMMSPVNNKKTHNRPL